MLSYSHPAKSTGPSNTVKAIVGLPITTEIAAMTKPKQQNSHPANRIPIATKPHLRLGRIDQRSNLPNANRITYTTNAHPDIPSHPGIYPKRRPPPSESQPAQPDLSLQTRRSPKCHVWDHGILTLIAAKKPVPGDRTKVDGDAPREWDGSGLPTLLYLTVSL